MNRRVYIAAMGAVTPWGVGIPALEDGLVGARVEIAPQDFPHIGMLPVARCTAAPVPREDRTITLLRVAAAEIARETTALAEVVPPARRATAAASSKGSLLLAVEENDFLRGHFLDFPADLPARVLAAQANARGPCQALVSACATGLHNITRAAEWIAGGHADMALAGSTEAALTPMYLASFRHLGAMSGTGSFPFDARHDGFVAGEGAAVLLLADGDTCARAGIAPLAELRGWASASEAHHWTSTSPDGRHVAALARRVLRHAGMAADDVDLVCVHGTGTPLNDEAEARAMEQVFGDAPPPAFGIKGAIGHLMGAAGAVELAASVLALRGAYIPATAGFDQAAVGCGGIVLHRQAQRHTVESVMKWNMGFGGHLVGCVVTPP